MVRKKVRYLVTQIQYEDEKIDTSVTQDDIFHALHISVKELYGDYGVAVYTMKIWIKYTNPYTGIFFLQCPQDHHKEIRTSLTFVKLLKRKRCVLNCIYLAATIKSAERYLLDYNAEKMNIMYERCKTPQEKRDVLKFMKELNIDHLIVVNDDEIFNSDNTSNIVDRDKF